jgi:predicted nucleic acid-binding Zn ribbon protein
MTDPWLPTVKHCSCCGAWLPLESFPANRRMHLGVSSRSKECHRAATKDWRDRNRERVNEERRCAYREAHPVEVRPCVVCGEPMSRAPNVLVCSERCRARRRAEQRRQRKASLNGDDDRVKGLWPTRTRSCPGIPAFVRVGRSARCVSGHRQGTQKALGQRARASRGTDR